MTQAAPVVSVFSPISYHLEKEQKLLKLNIRRELDDLIANYI